MQLPEPMNNDTLEQLADSLRYPTEQTAERARQAGASLETLDPPTADALSRLAGAVEADVHRMQERYTMLFDLNPVCNMYISHHIFGDDYRRGAALASLRAEFKKLELSEEGDLPDSLPNLLCLLARMPHGEDRQLLLELLLLPGCQRIAKRVSDNDGPYVEILRNMPRLLGEQTVSAGDDQDPQEAQPHV